MDPTSNHVDADDPVVGELLRETVDLVRRHGGHLAPGAVIVERDHDLRIEFRGDALSDGPLITIPRELLVPVDGITWEAGDARPASGHESLPEPTLRSLELMSRIFVACGKVDRFCAVSPRLAAGADPDLAQAIDVTRRPGADTGPVEAVPTFISSRVLAARDPADPARRRKVIMPLIDAANHDHEGAFYRHEGGALRFDRRQALGTAECFASYGPSRDPLELALHYGFASVRSPVANSVPARIDLPGGRRLHLIAQRPGQRRAPTVTAGDEELAVSHLTFRRHRPGSTRAELTMAVGAWVLRGGGTTAEAERLGDSAWDDLVRANLVALGELGRVAGARDDPAGRILSTAVELQTAIILECTG